MQGHGSGDRVIPMAHIFRIVGYALIFSWGLLLVRTWYFRSGADSPIQGYVLGISIVAIVIDVVLAWRPRQTRQSLVRLGLLK